MIALQVLDIKLFMKQLLIGHNFDRFNISEGTITTFCTFSIDGAWQRDFLDPDHENVLLDREYTPWKNVRDFCFTLIKGKRTPIAFKFVFMLPEEDIPHFLTSEGILVEPEEIYGLFLNFTYRDKKLLVTTGTSRRTFTMDRSIDNAWDLYVQSFLRNNGIATEQIQ